MIRPKRNAIRRCAIAGALLFFLQSGCLPADSRPEPGSLTTTVIGTVATRDGVSTEDGWVLEFDRALLLLGPMQLGDDCNKHGEYTEPAYERIFDVTLAESQKLSIMYGLGTCDIDFKVGISTEERNDVLLGTGVSEADKTFMQTAASDPFVASPSGVALHVEGTATKAMRALRFAWDIRQALFFKACSVMIGGQPEMAVTLQSGEAVTYELVVEAEAFFYDDLERANAALRFEPFATADATFGNADGVVTLDEIALVPLGERRAAGLGAYTPARSAAATLGEYVYREQWWTVVRRMASFRGARFSGECMVSDVED